MCEDFFADYAFKYMDVFKRLAQKIYPLLGEKKLEDMIENLAPELYFSESVHHNPSARTADTVRSAP